MILRIMLPASFQRVTTATGIIPSLPWKLFDLFQISGMYLVNEYIRGLEWAVPEREIVVGIWETETLILRLTAVIFVFALLRICRRKKETGRETVLYLIIVAASATVNLLRAGGGGFLMTLIGAMAAFAVSAPLLARDRIALRDIAAPVAAGSLLGPFGGLAAIAIAAVIYIIQRSAGRQPMVSDRLTPRFVPSGTWTNPAGRSVLAILENRRLRKNPRCNQDDCGITAGIDMLPWRTSLAVATLAVLMTDMFV